MMVAGVMERNAIRETCTNLRYALFRCGSATVATKFDLFTINLHDWFAGSEAIVLLFQCQWSNCEK